MERVLNILFGQRENGTQLFKNQQDLVNSFMAVEGTEYYVQPTDPDYTKAQNRLKAYVSQLLSDNVSLHITPVFVKALQATVVRKVGNTEEARRITDEVVDMLRTKKAISPKDASRQGILDQLEKDFKNARYISIITSKPLEIEAAITDQPSLRKFVFNDFIDSVISDEMIKDYRFNFPADTSAHMFWSGLNKLIFRLLKSDPRGKAFYTAIHKKLAMEFDAQRDMFLDLPRDDQSLITVTQTILEKLQKTCRVLAFETKAPIYTLPLIVMDPASVDMARVYAIIDLEDGQFNVHKFSHLEVVYWRQSVWDKLKTTHEGTTIKYERRHTV